MSDRLRDQETSPAAFLVMGATLLFAFALRVYLLDGQSLWYDEGTSAALAFRDLATIVRNAANDIHPPLYYFLLHFWVRVFGASEFALRFLSVAAGVLLVVVVYRLGQALFSPRTGLFAAFLAAVSPFQIYYSQETRMYILVSLWGALAILFLFRSLSLWQSTAIHIRTVAINLALYAATTALALYTHYFAFTLVLVANVYFLVWWSKLREGSRLILWSAAQLVIVALYFPWLLFAGGQLLTWPAVSEPFTLAFLANEVLRLFSLGPTSGTQGQLWLAVFIIIFVLGLWAQPKDKPYPRVLALLYFLTPPLLMYLISLNRPAFRPKFLLLATPGFLLLLAQGLNGDWIPHSLPTAAIVRRWGGVFVASALALATWPALSNYYFDPAYARDNYRGLAAYVAANGREGDGILLNAPTQIEIFSYYYHGPLPTYPLPQDRPLRPQETEQALEDIAKKHPHLFAVFWATSESDPGGFIEGWLDRRGFKTFEQWYGGVRLVLYSLPASPPSENIQSPRSILLGERIQFLGYNLYNPQLEAGDILQITFFWQATAPVAERYKVFIHVLDAQDQIVGQRDAEPGGGGLPTTTWIPGEIVVDHHGILIPEGTPPGEYRVEVGLYNLATGERLAVYEDGQPADDRFFLLPIRVP